MRKPVFGVGGWGVGGGGGGGGEKDIHSSDISIFKLVSVAEETGFNLTL